MRLKIHENQPKINMKSYLKFSSIWVVGGLPAQSKYGGKGSPPSLGWVFPAASTHRVISKLWKYPNLKRKWMTLIWKGFNLKMIQK